MEVGVASAGADPARGTLIQFVYGVEPAGVLRERLWVKPKTVASGRHVSVDTEAVQTRVLLLTPVGQDVELHGLVRLLRESGQGEGLQGFSTLVVHEASQEGFFSWLGLEALQEAPAPALMVKARGCRCTTGQTHVDFKVFGGRFDLAGGGVGDGGVLQRHVRDSDGVRQRDGQRAL